jgi:hypothetical protein
MACWVIHVKGLLDQSWSVELGGLTITHEKEGKTQISGPLPDEAALYGVLLKLYNLGIPLVSIQQDAADDGSHQRPHGPGREDAEQERPDDH